MEVPSEYFWLGWLWAILLAFHLTVFGYVARKVHEENLYFKSGAQNQVEVR